MKMPEMLAMWLTDAAREQRRMERKCREALRGVTPGSAYAATIQAMAEARAEAAEVFEKRLSDASATRA
jgi:hypothetical protein